MYSLPHTERKAKARCKQFKKTMRYTKTLIILIFLATFFAACSQTNSDNTNYNLGIYQLRQGDYEKAIEFLSKAIEENPKDTDAYYNRGVARQNIKLDSLSIFDYDKVVELRPTDFEAYDNRGVAKMRLGKNDEAIEDYKMAIKVNPNFALAYSNMGNAYRIKLDFDKACENWKKALELGHENCREKIRINCK